MADDKIPCTFEDCYQTFNTVEQMKKHKERAEDEVHEWYCKKCDEDCEDDITYLIHQIQSRKHIACPICGAEFKSESGRDRHVGINHKRKQELKCPGCKNMFESASGLMGHIERDKCKIITRDDFHKHRAEQQIQREALEELEGTMYQNAVVKAPVGSNPDSGAGGVSLLDNERVYLERDWQGMIRSDTRPLNQGSSSSAADNLSKDFSDLGIDRYPALIATRVNGSQEQQFNAGSQLSNSNSDLWDWSKEPEIRPGQPQPQSKSLTLDSSNVWANNKIVDPPPQLRQKPRAPSSNLLDAASSIDLLQSEVSNASGATRGSTTQAWRTFSTTANRTNQTLPPSSRPENKDPNAPYATIQTMPSKPRLPSRLDLHRYWDPIQSCYICPGSTCGAHISSVAAFEQHLSTSGAHVAEKVQCPSCLKKFKTTTALVAHAESGSVKCDLRNSAEYDLALRSITAGLIRIDGTWRDGSVKYESVPVDRW